MKITPEQVEKICNGLELRNNHLSVSKAGTWSLDRQVLSEHDNMAVRFREISGCSGSSFESLAEFINNYCELND